MSSATQNQRRKGRIFVLSSPSGGGKTSLVKALLKLDKGLIRPASYTTRQRRHGEKNGVDYNFINEDEFKRRLENNDFLEWSKPFGRYYATPKNAVLGGIKKGKDVILSLDYRGARFIKKNFKKDAASIYVLPPSVRELKQRLEGRMTDHSAEIKKRLSYAKKDIARLAKYDYVVINDNFKEAVGKLRSIIIAERLKVR